MLMAADSRRKLIESRAKGTAEDLLAYLQEMGVELPVKPENTRKTNLYIAGQEPSGCLIEEGGDTYTRGRNGGRIIFANANPRVVYSKTPEGEKIRRVVYHLAGIIFVRKDDPGADIDEFPGKYPSATDPKMRFSLTESAAERMERLTGRPIDLDEGGYKKEGAKGMSAKETDPKREDLEDRLKDLFAEVARQKQTWDSNNDMDFGSGFELSAIGYEDPDAERLEKIDRELSSGRVAGGGFSEEFQAARIIMIGKGGEENWKRVFRNLLLEDEKTSIAYLKGIYNY